MYFLIAATYVILAALIIFLLILIRGRGEKDNIEINDARLGLEDLEKHAVEIARNHIVGKRTKSSFWLIPRVEKNYKLIVDTYKILNKDARDQFPLVPAAEWLLDNFYVIEEQAVDIKSSLTKGYYSQLPILKNGYLRGYPRVYAIALELVAHTDGKIDEKVVANFIRAYQTQTVLSIGELWAMAVMLRTALFENIRYICEKVIDSQHQWHRSDELAIEMADALKAGQETLENLLYEKTGHIDIDPSESSFIEYLVRKLRNKGGNVSTIVQYLDTKLAEQNTSTQDVTALEHQLQAQRQISIGNTITSLRMVSTIDWADIFEALSQVELILRQDPDGIYSKMDFESRDYYRNKIEKLSRSYKLSEIQVARKAVECAAQAQAVEETAPRHVGYYLIGKGLDELEGKLGYKPSGIGGVKFFFRRHPTMGYLGIITLLTFTTASLFAYYGAINAANNKATMIIIAGLAALVPSSELAVAIANWCVSRIKKPVILPKLELKDGIPEELCTMVIVPTLLPGEKRVKELINQLEVFYLANKEKNLFFSLVGDFKDAEQKELPEDNKIITAALEGIRELNSRYSQEKDIFFYFNRHRQYNDRQERWMGWERKRGAIMELNDLLRGNRDTSYTIVSQDNHKLPHVKYIITLDADTLLPMGNARRLIGTLAHPLNAAVTDQTTGFVLEGYGLLQPRINVNIVSANSTLFSRIFAGQGGIDPYTTAVSDVYQDLFGEGIFTGKGIYDIDVFQNALKEKIPDNSILSHDLLEGSYVRTGLVTDIELVDGYPARYNSYAMRLHRWVRGDWQLLPWLFSNVRDKDGKIVKNPFSAITKWKIFDNLRRSLVNPSLLLLIILGLTILPGNSLVWLGLSFMAAGSPIVIHLINAALSEENSLRKHKRHSTIIYGFRAALLQTILVFVFIPYKAALMMDAIFRTLIRLTITRKNLLEWVTAADMEANLRNDVGSFIKRMWISPLAGFLVFLLAIWNSYKALIPAALILAAWGVAPYIAYVISLPYKRKVDILSSEDMEMLRLIARKTWAYFEDFAEERDNYLPPDNYQENPLKGVAHRTSPTNIGLLLISTLAARDFGYLNTAEMALKVNNTINTIEKLQKWKGHLYNWYDTDTLEILKPAYISTVDSGNFIGYMMVLEQGIRECLTKPFIDMERLKGLKDIIYLYNQEQENDGYKVDISALQRIISNNTVDMRDWKTAVEALYSEITAKTGANTKAVYSWRDKAISILDSLRYDLTIVLKVLDNNANIPSFEQFTEILREKVADAPSFSSDGASLQTSMDDSFSTALSGFEGTIKIIWDLVVRIQSIITDTKFYPLYDPKRQLFSIGFNVEEGHLSKSYYDLFASEVRQASYIAVARGEVDKKHWFRLGRKLTRINEYKGLISWTGTMFEYLMPLLIMKNYENTILDETYQFVVDNQIKYGTQRNIPWGISESGFNAFDINLNYQYKAFGIPGLGLKRGLESDIVVAPYATILALAVDPARGVDNIRRLKKEGMESYYGFYEAIDYTPSRLKKDQNSSIVRSFMAHHQGMSLVALDNLFNENIMQKRFHANPVIRAGELLLQERMPAKVIFTKDLGDKLILHRRADHEDGEVIRTFGLPDSELPNVHLLSNGSYSVMVTSGGSGYSRYYGTAVTRWHEKIGEISGSFIYIENINSNMPWSASFEPYNLQPEKYRVVFSPDKAEFFRKDGNIETHTEIIVSPEDNAEIRKVSLTNRSQHERVLEVTSYSEVVLAHPADDLSHPAFSKLFVRTEYVPKYNCLIASRRSRHEGQKTVWAVHSVSTEAEIIGDIQYETDRMKFIGRNRNLGNPAAMDPDQPLTNTSGAVLDPVMSLRIRIKIKPGHTVSLSFMTGVADARKTAKALAEKYQDSKVIDRAFDMSWTRSQIESGYLGLKSDEVEQYLALVPAILYPSSFRTQQAEFIMENKRGQTSLWPFGISGDMPIVLANITSVDQAHLVYWCLKAHEFWRTKGLSIDLVMLVEDEGGYLQPLQDLIRDAISSSHARDVQDKPGGVFVRNSKLMSDEDKTLFYTAARIVIKTSIEDLIEKIKAHYTKGHADLLKVSQKAGMRESEPAAYAARYTTHDNLDYFNGLGGFGNDGKEYIIYLRNGQSTPAPWVNVIANDTFGFLISETGASYTWAENSRENKLTPWSNDPVSNPSGEVFYVRDEERGDFWSITPSPVRGDGEYVIRHGFGYSVFSHDSNGIEQQLTQFSAVDDAVKICIIKLKNISGKNRKLSVTYYVRPVLGVNDRETAPYITTELHGDTGTILVSNSFNSDFPGRVVFVDSSLTYHSCTGDRFEFVGANGNLEEPAAMKREILSGRLGAGLDPCAAMQVVLSLEADEEREIVFLLGQGTDKEQALQIAEKYRDAALANSELDRVKKQWKERLEVIQVHTPDLSMDILLNGWLLYQVISCRLWARSAFYQSGGAYGFRDQLQDVMSVVYSAPQLMRDQILLHSSRQFVEGDVQHWWHSGEGKGIRTKYSDDLLWLPYVTADYIECTEDYSVLDEMVSYLTGQPLGEDEDERYDIPGISEESTNVYEHCIRTIERSLRFGEHGIPLMGSGDWNDGMNKVGNKGKGESVWLGWFLCTVLKRFIPICISRGDVERAQRYGEAVNNIGEALEAEAWDGSWYRRAYFDNGVPLGSMQNNECRIDSISQSWAVISGLGRQKRVIEAMMAVENYLIDRGEGIIKLLTPPFDKGELNPGYIKGYVPGVRENGGQYSHAATWVILAFAMLGNGNKAWELFHMINPINHTRSPMEYLRYKVEPYVMAADVYAVYPHAGRGGWSWYTGAAGWMYRVGTEHLLGLRKRGDKLQISPCIPGNWGSYQIKYKFGNSIYNIEINNPNQVSSGVKSIFTDGILSEDGLVHLTDDGAEHSVKVEMG